MIRIHIRYLKHQDRTPGQLEAVIKVAWILEQARNDAIERWECVWNELS